MQMAIAARAANAAIALGMNVSSPASFAAALEATADLTVPPLSLSREKWGLLPPAFPIWDSSRKHREDFRSMRTCPP